MWSEKPICNKCGSKLCVEHGASYCLKCDVPKCSKCKKCKDGPYDPCSDICDECMCDPDTGWGGFTDHRVNKHFYSSEEQKKFYKEFVDED